RLVQIADFRQRRACRQIILPQILIHDHVEFRGDSRPQRPADALAHIVSGRLRGRGADVAGGARGRGRIVDTDDPLVAFDIEAVLARRPQDAVLGFLIDLDLRMIRTEMALAASLRLTRLRLREAMAGVTGAAAAPAAVRVDAANPGIRPG